MMLDQAGPVRTGEVLDLARLKAYLQPLLPIANGTFSVEQFCKGHSNLTYLLHFGDQEFVLRRPPFGNTVKSAHDMGREFRVLSKLCNVYGPAPRPYVYCEDHNVLGDEFYVMEKRSGMILRENNTPAELSSNPESVRKLCESFVDNLVLLHSIDFRAAGLGDIGRPEGYVERQVTGWIKRYENARSDNYPDVERLGEWLASNRPADAQPALIHNDYKYDNLMLAPNNLTQIIAVLDWEMATVGDRFMDLGMALAYWVQADDTQTQRQGAFGPTTLPGSFTRQEILARYADQCSVEIPNVLFYYCFGLFKLAVIIQQIYARFVRGATSDARFAGMNVRVESLGKVGMQAIKSGEV